VFCAVPGGHHRLGPIDIGQDLDQRLSLDPWDRPYQYLSPGQHGEIDIYTLGRDGRPGGEGPDADIGNWDPEPR
jgi:type II secretion system protein G